MCLRIHQIQFIHFNDLVQLRVTKNLIHQHKHKNPVIREDGYSHWDADIIDNANDDDTRWSWDDDDGDDDNNDGFWWTFPCHQFGNALHITFGESGGAPLRSIIPFAKHNVARLNGRATRCVIRSTVAIVVLCDMQVQRHRKCCFSFFIGCFFPLARNFVTCGGQLMKHLSTTQKVGSIFSS